MSKIDETLGELKPKINLEQWRLRGSHLVGIVYNHPHLENGATVGLRMGSLTLSGVEVDSDTSDTAPTPPLEAGIELETPTELLYQLGKQQQHELPVLFAA